MRLSEIVSEDRILVPLEAETLDEAIGLLCHRLEVSGTLPRGAGTRLAGEFFSGARGEVIRVNQWVVLLAAQTQEVGQLLGTLGSARSPFDLGGQGEGGTASVLLLLLTPRRVSPLKIQAIPTLSRFLRGMENTTRLRAARTPAEVLALSDLMELDIQDQLLVADGVDPLRYRVYPDTTMDEVIGLMVRRGIRAVPVVGEKLDFLGLITSVDAIRHLLPGQMTGAGDGERLGTVPARDVMIRSVMCVSEEQSLLEAANLMANKGVAQLPVVREGELIGFLSMETALQLLWGPRKGGSGPSERSGAGKES
jgi:CBS domain-containing protein